MSAVANGTHIRFELPETADVRIQVFGLDGRIAADLSAGVRFPGALPVSNPAPRDWGAFVATGDWW